MEAVHYSSTYSLDSYLRLESKNIPLQRPGWRLNNWRSLRNFPFAQLGLHPGRPGHCPSWNMGRPGSCSCRRTLNEDVIRGWLIRLPLQWLQQPLRIILMGQFYKRRPRIEPRLLPPPRPRTLTQQIWLEVIQRLFPDLLRPHCWSGHLGLGLGHHPHDDDARDLHWLRLTLPCNG